MPRRVNQIKLILFTDLGNILQAHSSHLYRNPALPFQIHAVQHLLTRLAAHRASHLQNPVSKRGFAVVNMRDDAEIPNAFGNH